MEALLHNFFGSKNHSFFWLEDYPFFFSKTFFFFFSLFFPIKTKQKTMEIKNCDWAGRDTKKRPRRVFLFSAKEKFPENPLGPPSPKAKIRVKKCSRQKIKKSFFLGSRNLCFGGGGKPHKETKTNARIFLDWSFSCVGSCAGRHQKKDQGGESLLWGWGRGFQVALHESKRESVSSGRKCNQMTERPRDHTGMRLVGAL